MTTSSPSASTSNGTFSLLLLLFLSLTTLSLSQNCNPQDLKALRQIQQQLGNPPELSFWQTQEDCCSWSSNIGCDETTGRVTSLSIVNVQNVTNHIPDVIGDLPYLELLDLYALPNLTGRIPSGLARLTRLQFLNIGGTNVSGPIPSSLGQIKTLTNLRLLFNQLSGSIPPSLSSLPNLQELNLGWNRLTGRIPESFGNFPPSLQYFALSNNQLTGTVPRSLGYLNFTYLDFTRNQLVGDVSFLFGKNKTYYDVHLSRNKFSFDFSKIEVNTVGGRGEGLQYLDVSHNLITGNLPASFKDIDWKYLDVSYNQMCGEIPKGGSLQKFGIPRYLHNKCLCGSPLPRASDRSSILCIGPVI